MVRVFALAFLVLAQVPPAPAARRIAQGIPPETPENSGFRKNSQKKKRPVGLLRRAAPYSKLHKILADPGNL